VHAETLAAGVAYEAGIGWPPPLDLIHKQPGMDMNHSDRITLDPAICHGKPCIRGLRYPVESLLELLAGGMTIEAILADYEDLERDDIRAALSYAARLAHVKRMERFAA
jgi:uncharacterized protein (DUF433 family)